MERFDVAIIGGDKRTAQMAGFLSDRKLKIIVYGTVGDSPCVHARNFQEAVDSSGCLIFGIPFQIKQSLFFQAKVPDVSLTELQRCLRKNQKIFGGVIPEDFRRHCEEREICCYDFMQDETLTVFNAIATAEGAILEALLHRETNLHNSKCLVLGYGRCGKVLADKLKGLNACVTVCSNDRQELALADALGMETLLLPRLIREIHEFEYFFNTIPAMIINEACLKRMHKKCLLIDIASSPGGIDYHAAEMFGIPCYSCPGLPGKYASRSSAERLSAYVLDKIC